MIMADFNARMQSLRHEYLQTYLAKDMRAYWNRYQWKRMRETYLPQYRKSTVKKCFPSVLLELLMLQLHWRCVPYHYFRYGLYDLSYSYQKVLDYLPETVFYYRILPQINTEYVLLDDKSICYDILKAHNIPVPHIYFYTKNRYLYDNNDHVITNEEEFSVYLDQLPENTIVVGKKVQCGSGGHDIVFLQIKNHTIVFNNQEITFESLVKEYNNWIFQEKISNAPPISDVYPYALNTLRVLSYYDSNEVKIVYAMLKFGNNYAKTDNAHTGGMYVKIDINTGSLSPFAFDEDFDKFDKHPLTGVTFEGLVIPQFDDVLQVVRNAAKLFPYLKCVGWDVALSKDGPVLIEGNSSPGLTIIQRTHFGMKDFMDLYYGNTENRT